jgi:hypothetical protein
MQDQWYYLCAGKQAGPVSTDDLRRLVGAGQLGDADEVWRVGTPDWRPVRQVPEFADLLGNRPAVAVQAPPVQVTAEPVGLPTAEPSFANLAQIRRWLTAGPVVVLRHSLFGAVGGMIGSACLLLIGGGMLIQLRPDVLVPFLIALALAGAGLLGVLYNFVVLLDRRPQLVLGREGLYGAPGRVRRPVRWEQIEKAHLSQLLRNGATTDAVITLTVRGSFGLPEQVAVDVYRLSWDPQRIFHEIGRRAGLTERAPGAVGAP